MSAQSLAAFRKNAGDDLADLAEQHLKHDLTESDRQILLGAANTLSTHALVGSVLGLSLGALLALRLRRGRAAMFAAFRASERPTALRFANGREEPLPDLAPLMKPSTLGDIVTYTFFAAGGIFVGGEIGVATGIWSAKRGIARDEDAKCRIDAGWRRFRADVLRKQADQLEKGLGSDGPSEGDGGVGGLWQ